MIQYRPVFHIIGILTATLGLLMLVPMVVDLTSANQAAQNDWQAFAAASMICLLAGGGIAVANMGKIENFSVKQGFLITSFSWIILSIAATLPLMLGDYGLSFIDAIFETVSGLTTTGATVLSGLDTAPPGLLLWRSLLQWIGGIGIVIMAVALMPMLSIGGMQLFRLESSDTSDKILPGASQIALGITGIYIFLSLLCAFIYWALGMTSFDAINHSMTTLATGGFSTKDTSFSYFLNSEDARGPLDLVATVFMILGSLPFTLFLVAARGNIIAVFKDEQVQFFLSAILIFSIIITVTLLYIFPYDLFTAWRLSAFSVASAMSGTGYASTDYGQWGAFANGFFFCIIFMGGCAGSASCGLKVFRVQVAFSALLLYGRRLIFPHGVFVARYNGRPLTDEVFVSVFSFFFVYFATFATCSVILSLYQLDPVTALSASGSAIANFGLGLGDIVGPTGNNQSLPDGAKVALTITMLMGRLEFFTLLVLFAPSFWRD
ncbi:MAG: TrkH family potassium uptake protein [bacterium]